MESKETAMRDLNSTELEHVYGGGGAWCQPIRKVDFKFKKDQKDCKKDHHSKSRDHGKSRDHSKSCGRRY
jgi:hypothetical protein